MEGLEWFERLAQAVLHHLDRNAIRCRSCVIVIVLGDCHRDGRLPFGHARKRALEPFLMGASR